MPTTKEDIREWLQRGKELGATHMIVVCDTFDHEDFPVYVLLGEDARKIHDQYNDAGQMSRVMEVYSYARNLDEQLAGGRVYNFD